MFETKIILEKFKNFIYVFLILKKILFEFSIKFLFLILEFY